MFVESFDASGNFVVRFTPGGSIVLTPTETCILLLVNSAPSDVQTILTDSCVANSCKPVALSNKRIAGSSSSHNLSLAVHACQAPIVPMSPWMMTGTLKLLFPPLLTYPRQRFWLKLQQ